MEFRYELSGRGWADCHVEIAGQRADVVASYLSDALENFAGAIASVLRGDAAVTVSFEGEPTEYRWHFNRVGSDRLRIRILELEDMMARLSDERGRVLLDAECRLRTFAGAVVSELQRLLREHGEAGYRQRWVHHEFPRRRLEQLQALLAA